MSTPNGLTTSMTGPTVAEPSLVEFLLARLTEDEAAAERLRRPSEGDPWGWQPKGVTTNDAGRVEISPARVLADVEAKRRIVDLHYEVTSDSGYCVVCVTNDYTDEPYPCPTIRALASVYRNHPDWREEWA